MKEQYSPRLEPPSAANLPSEAPTEEEEPKDVEGTRWEPCATTRTIIETKQTRSTQERRTQQGATYRQAKKDPEHKQCANVELQICKGGHMHACMSHAAAHVYQPIQHPMQLIFFSHMRQNQPMQSNHLFTWDKISPCTSRRNRCSPREKRSTTSRKPPCIRVAQLAGLKKILKKPEKSNPYGPSLLSIFYYTSYNTKKAHREKRKQGEEAWLVPRRKKVRYDTTLIPLVSAIWFESRMHIFLHADMSCLGDI